jgi:hypothetical protein
MRYQELLEATGYQYLRCCVDFDDSNVQYLEDMIEHGREISYGTLVKAVGISVVAEAFPDYDWSRRPRDLTLKRDYHVRYYKSRYRDTPCYYIVHSAIEYIFVPNNYREPMHEHGFDIDAYHGTNQDITAFAHQKNAGGSSSSRESHLGFWFTNSPDAANSFAAWADRNLGGANVLPVKLKIKHPLVVQNYDEIRAIVDRFTEFERPGYIIGGRQIRMTGDKIDYKAAKDWLKAQGYDGIVLKNTDMDSPDGKTLIDQYVVFDPSQIRSRFAKFDPDKADSHVLTDSR